MRARDASACPRRSWAASRWPSRPGSARRAPRSARAERRSSRTRPAARRARSRAPSVRCRRASRSRCHSCSVRSMRTPRWPEGPRSTQQRIRRQAPPGPRRRTAKLKLLDRSRASRNRSASSGCRRSTSSRRSPGAGPGPRTSSAPGGSTRRSSASTGHHPRSQRGLHESLPARPDGLERPGGLSGSPLFPQAQDPAHHLAAHPLRASRSSRVRSRERARTPVVLRSERLRRSRASAMSAWAPPVCRASIWTTSSSSRGARANSGRPHRERNFWLAGGDPARQVHHQETLRGGLQGRPQQRRQARAGGFRLAQGRPAPGLLLGPAHRGRQPQEPGPGHAVGGAQAQAVHRLLPGRDRPTGG